MMAHIMKKASHLDHGPSVRMTSVFIVSVQKSHDLY